MTDSKETSANNNVLALATILLVICAGTIGTFLSAPKIKRQQTLVQTAETDAPGAIRNRLDPEPVVNVAWLITFPHSGTSYTQTNLLSLTGIGLGHNLAGTVFKKQVTKDGPFYGKSGMEVTPSQYLLTKSHCDGFCHFCDPENFVFDAERFESGCRKTIRYFSLDEEGREIECYKAVHGRENQGKATCDKSRRSSYPVSLVKRAVHLMRHPIDNMVSRINVDLRNWKLHQERHPAALWGDETLSHREQIVAYCNLADESDGEALVDMVESEETTVAEMPICFVEIYKYLSWHDNALEMLDRIKRSKKNFKTLHFFYEDYSTNYNQTVRDLLDFVNYPMKGQPLPFVANKTYVDLFTETEQEQIYRYIQRHASPKLWSILNGRYSFFPASTNPNV